MTRRLTTMILAIALIAGTAAAQPAGRGRGGDASRDVTLPLSEYNRLMDLARSLSEASIPPVEAVLSSADLRVRVEDSAARGQFTLTGQVLREGIGRVTLMTGATVIEANAGGRPLPLKVTGAVHEAWLPGPGPFTATLEWGTAVTHRPGRALFILPVPPAGAARATIDLPGDQADVRLSHGSITRRSTSNGRTIVEATLDSGLATEVWWSMRDSAPIAAARDARMMADVMTLLTIGDTDVRMVALIDVTVLQGEPRTMDLRLPAGYQLTGITGSSLETSEPIDDHVVLTVIDPAARRHQFLVTLERPHADGSFMLESGLVTIADVQRERGEVAVEGIGTLDLTTTERVGMHRIDVREVNAVLQSVARTPLLAAYRYQRTPTMQPALDLAVSRFADAGVLAASVDRAVATTLVTSEGRALTEVLLHVKNRAQPFLKVQLPAGASIVSVTVAGETAKPVLGADGSRVPLLRPGFRPVGPYDVSFVYLHAGAPLGRKGDIQMLLPRMDIPVGVVSWEVFAPSNYSLRHVDGNVIGQSTLARALARNARMVPAMARTITGAGQLIAGTALSDVGMVITLAPNEASGVVHGVVKDTSGGVLPGVTISIAIGNAIRTATTSGDGTFRFMGIPRGPARLTAALTGFTTVIGTFTAGDRGHTAEITMRVGAVEETMSVTTVTGAAPIVDVQTAAAVAVLDRDGMEIRELRDQPSENVINLQRRIAGVLPIRVDVPRAGTSYRFSRPLVVDDETRVAFQYKRR